MMFQSRILVSVLLLATTTTNAFVVGPGGAPHQKQRLLWRTTSSPSTGTTSSSSSTQQFLTPDVLPDASALSDFLVTTSQFVADAATAVGEQKDLGWWGSYLKIFKNTLTFVHSTISPPLRSLGVEQTWGVSIAVFTMLIRSALLPLSINQSKSAEYMKALKPYQNEIKERFKDNPDMQNRAIAKLFEDANQNPLAGCATSLAQLPILLGLYRGISLLAKDGQLEEPFLFIPSLEGPVGPPDYRGLDWLLQGWTPGVDGGLPIPSMGWETTLAFLIMPITLVVLQSVTMSTLQPPVDDAMSEEEKQTVEQSQKIFKFLPLLIGFFSVQVPAGLTIYWFTSNIFTLAQSLGAKAYFAANPPEIELPDYWDTALDKEKDFADMTPEERREAVKAGIQVGPKMNDLVDEARFHCYIDRYSFREETEAWQRVLASSSSSSSSNGSSSTNNVPAEFQEWVAAAGKTLVKDVEAQTTAAEKDAVRG